MIHVTLKNHSVNKIVGKVRKQIAILMAIDVQHFCFSLILIPERIPLTGKS